MPHSFAHFANEWARRAAPLTKLLHRARLDLAPPLLKVLIGTSTQYTFLPGHNFQNSYTYDAASNRTSLTAPDGSTNTYQYDTLNRLSTGAGPPLIVVGTIDN